MSQRSSLYDQPDSFGWVSIAMHWLSAVVIIALWFIGKSIANQDIDAIDARRSLHVTIGLAAWLLLAWLLPDSSTVVAIIRAVHASAATVLAVLVVVHILGSLKHLMFNDDETIVRIFLPRKR